MKYFLISLFFVSVSSCIKQKTEGVNVVDATVFEQSLTIENAQVVDARTASEYATGKIPNAINIDVLEDDFSTKVAQLDKTKPILVYCKSGVRSTKATAILKELGFTTIYELEGGITSWNTQGKPIED